MQQRMRNGRAAWILIGGLASGLGPGLVACGDDVEQDGSGSTTASQTSGTTAEASTSSSTAMADESSSGSMVEPGECATPIPAVELPDARLSVTRAGRLVDAQGRDVVMRGLNTGGRSKFAPFLPFELDEPGDLTDLQAVRDAADVYYGRLPGWGLDTVRMPFSWEALEPMPGQYDMDYLARYQAMLDAAWARRLRVIVDFHQDVYASPFCGDGFPPWSIPTADPPPPTHDCPQWFLGYFTNVDVRESFDRFWSDADGLQAQYLAMWLTMVDAVGGHPAVVGFEPMNEPGWGSMDDLDAFKQDVLQPFFTDVAAQLRTAAPDVLVFYDGPGADSTGVGSHFRPDGEGLVYGPHRYDSTLLFGDAWSGIDPTPALQSAATFGADNGVPVLLGEFGYADGAEGGDEWLTIVMDVVDARRMSATLWEYSTSSELWNGEDLSVTDADGTERAILDAYVRPWVRAVAGSSIGVQWDRDQGVLSASWTASEGVTEVVVPARRFPAGPDAIELQGAGACYTWDEERGELRVTAPAGTAVSLTLR
ncbi:cellulase family glycosylhydrolase [Paraliomyxa miuraensis]|uniref:cellulase family glycosylhydrolase n=1 Tax=Paraliomyxa miuraensis TaxID=376150 RepID=UPI0022527801|nr:cellulase family glycosylhydrolase [Paraliomyxa miuraensis]MCX4240964.1 cellulase family glycosylhydrolase [Paraliomyxa miuraensis]